MKALRFVYTALVYAALLLAELRPTLLARRYRAWQMRRGLGDLGRRIVRAGLIVTGRPS